MERSAEVLARWPAGFEALNAPERERARSFARSSDRDDFVAAHLLARECVARLLGLAATAVDLLQRCERCGGPHGRPTVVGHPGIGVSWSHTQGYVHAVADHRAVGVDLERLDSLPAGPVEPGLLHRFATVSEARAVITASDPRDAFLKLWVCKESLVKVAARNLDDFRSVDLLGVLSDPDGRTTWAGHDVRALVSDGFAVGFAGAAT